MRQHDRLEIPDWRNGRDVIVEWVNGEFEFWEKEFGGVRWYQFKGTGELLDQASRHFCGGSLSASIAA